MARFDDLPADQKAVLQLLLKQGKSYGDLSSLLRIEPEAVRDRALTALMSLAPEDSAGLTPDREDELGDYLLGQQTASQRASTREFLEGSAGGRAWARVVAGELRQVAGDALPEIPAEGAEIDAAFDALEARQQARVQREKSSKLGGVLLLVGLGIAVAAALALILGGGDDDGDRASTTRTTQTQTTAGTTVEAQVNLQAAREGSRALGVANVVRQNGQRGFAVIGQGLPKSAFYALWLYDSPSRAQFVGFFPPVADNGQLQGLAAAPEGYENFRELVVTRERVKQPKRPGTIVLRGRLQD